MNASDRKQVAEYVETLEKLASDFDQVKEQIRELAQAEREKFDNMPEGLQQGERGEAIEQAADNLDTAAEADSPSDALEALNSIGQ